MKKSVEVMYSLSAEDIKNAITSYLKSKGETIIISEMLPEFTMLRDEGCTKELSCIKVKASIQQSTIL